MFPSKLLPQTPSAHDQAVIEQHARALLEQHLPFYRMRDIGLIQHKAAKLFKSELREALRNELHLLDRRSVIVELHVTPHGLPTHWYVEVYFDTRARGMYHSLLFPLTVQPR